MVDIGDKHQCEHHQPREELDAVMVVTAFGIFVYCAFTVIAGVLDDGLSGEPNEIVIINGIVELVQVRDGSHYHIKRQITISRNFNACR